MMHITDGELRAYHDHELEASERVVVEKHLATCAECQVQSEDLSTRSQQMYSFLAALPPPTVTPSVKSARAKLRVRQREEEKEKRSMFRWILRSRMALGALTAILVVALLLTLPPVQALANNFLGLFRVQQITVVQIDPANLEGRLGSSSQIDALLSDSIQVEERGDIERVDSAAEASKLAGIAVRLPAEMKEEPSLLVQPGANVSLKLDLPRVRALTEAMQVDVELPDSLDGETITADIPRGVMAAFGECRMEDFAKQERGMERDGERGPPDGRRRMPENCSTLAQFPSPTVVAPPEFPIADVGQAFLQLMGMDEAEAASFSENLDWSTTLVIPIPRYGTDYRDVSVDGVTGTLIQQSFDRHDSGYILLWIKDGIIYALTGSGDGADAVRIANSMQ